MVCMVSELRRALSEVITSVALEKTLSEGVLVAINK